MVITTDLLVEGRHFRQDWSSAYDVGRKAAAQNLADIVAMGARATALVVGFGAPADLPTAWAVELNQGIVDEAELLGVSIVGGDTVQSDKIVVSITAFGSLDGRKPVLRSGARPGDEVAFIGRLGWAEAGVAVLNRGFRSPRTVVDAHRRPQPPYAEGPRAAIAGASSMCDVSDGLLADLGHIAEASEVRDRHPFAGAGDPGAAPGGRRCHRRGRDDVRARRRRRPRAGRDLRAGRRSGGLDGHRFGC